MLIGAAESARHSTHDDGRVDEVFRVTHPFHPRFGQEFKLVFRRRFQAEGWVFSHDENGREFRMPDHWTSLVQPDPFVVISDGRSRFHVDDLVRLARLIKDLDEVPPRMSSKEPQSDA